MAQPRTSSRDQRLQRLAYIQSLEGPQQPQPPQPQQTDLLGQLGQLYSLQQNMELAPARTRAANAEADVMQSRASGEVKPTDILEYFSRTAQALPPELQYLTQTPESRATTAKAAEDKRVAQEQDKQRIALQAAASQGDQNAVAQLQQMGFVNPNAPTTAPANNLPGFWEALNQLLGSAFSTRNINVPSYNPMVTNTAEAFRR